MSYPSYKDFDKKSSDILTKDFDYDVSFKIKELDLPYNTKLTTTSFYDCKDNKVKPKTSIKWDGRSDFVVEKLEVSSDLKKNIELSCKLPAIPDCKLTFKGDDDTQADLSFDYSNSSANFTGEVDLGQFQKVKGTVTSGHGPFSVGASAELKFGSKSAAIDSSDIGLAVGYSLPSSFLTTFKAEKNFSSFCSSFSYIGFKDITIAGLFRYATTNSVFCATLGGVAKCSLNPNRFYKLKTTNKWVVSASVKQAFEKNFSVVGSAEVNVPSGLNSIKWGLNATLG